MNYNYFGPVNNKSVITRMSQTMRVLLQNMCIPLMPTSNMIMHQVKKQKSSQIDFMNNEFDVLH